MATNTPFQTTLLISLSDRELSNLIYENVTKAIINLGSSISDSEDKTEIIDGKELTKRLNISEPTLIRYRQKGKIPFMQVGSAIRYDYQKVLEALESKKKGGK